MGAELSRPVLWTFFLFASLVLNASRGAAAVSAKSGTNDAATADALFSRPSLRLLRFEIPAAGMTSLRREPRIYVRARLQEDGIVYTNILVRLKGGASSFRPINDKPGLTIKVDATSKTFYGLRKFHLNNSVQDETYLSEWVCGDIFRQAGVPAPRALPVLVELNGRRLGLYVLLENVNNAFLGRWFKTPDGNVYSPPGNTDITGSLDRTGGREGNTANDLQALAAAARTRDPARLAKVLDLERFLSFMAVEVMLCHWDGYTSNIKNYLVYHDVDAQKMVFIPHDLDSMLQDWSRTVLPRPKGVVARVILAHSVTRNQYLRRFGEIYSSHFVPRVLTERIDEIVKTLAPDIAAYDPQMGQAFSVNAIVWKGRIVNRHSALRAELKAIDPTLIQK